MTEESQVIAFTGITGFLGSSLAKAFIDAGYKVKGFRRRTSDTIRIEDISSQIIWFDIDTVSNAELDSFLQNVNFVIHTAGNYGRKGEATSTILEANLMFGLLILESSIRVKVPCFINTATALPNDTNYYTRSKAQFSEWGKTFAFERKISFFDVRLELMYGPGDDNVKFIQYVIEACFSNSQDLELTSGIQKRDFVYIDDVIAAYLVIVKNFKILESDSYLEIPLGSGLAVSVRSVVEMIHSIANSRISLNFGAKQFTSVDKINTVANITILERMGWSAKMNIEDGITSTINEYKKLIDIVSSPIR